MTCIEWFLAHLSWKLKWAFLITCCLPSVCLSVNFPHFIFCSKTTGPISTNFAQSMLRWRRFKLFKWRSTSFYGKIITKWWKYTNKILKSYSPEPLGQYQPNLAQKILGWSEVSSNDRSHSSLPRGDNYKKANYTDKI